MKGVIKFYNQQKSFGFIKVQGEKDIFFHKSALERDYVPEEDDYVEFRSTETDRGRAAVDITKA